MQKIGRRFCSSYSKSYEDTPWLGACRTAIENLNEQRDQNGYPLLSLDRQLCNEAEAYAKHLAKTKYWRHADAEDLNGASECLYATQGEKPAEIHMKMAIESWLSERNQFDWDKQKGNNYSNVMWKSTHMIGIGTGISDRGWIFVVARLYPPGNQAGYYEANLPHDGSGAISWRDPTIFNPSGKSSTGQDYNNSRRKSSTNSTNFDNFVTSTKKQNGTSKQGSKSNGSAASKTEPFIEYNQTGAGYRGTFSSSSYVIPSDEETEPVKPVKPVPKARRSTNKVKTPEPVKVKTPTPVKVKKPEPVKVVAPAKPLKKKSPKKAVTIEPMPKLVSARPISDSEDENAVQISKDSDVNSYHQFVDIQAKVNSTWKREAINGRYQLKGLNKFNEPFYARVFNKKNIFISLWGNEGKRKWRIGPDCDSKICWLYTKKRSTGFGIPVTGWSQSDQGKWTKLDSISITLSDV